MSNRFASEQRHSAALRLFTFQFHAVTAHFFAHPRPFASNIFFSASSLRIVCPLLSLPSPFITTGCLSFLFLLSAFYLLAPPSLLCSIHALSFPFHCNSVLIHSLLLFSISALFHYYSFLSSLISSSPFLTSPILSFPFLNLAELLYTIPLPFIWFPLLSMAVLINSFGIVTFLFHINSEYSFLFLLVASRFRSIRLHLGSILFLSFPSLCKSDLLPSSPFHL